MKKIILFVAVCVVVVIGIFHYMAKQSVREAAPSPTPTEETDRIRSDAGYDGRNGTFMIDGKEVTLLEGKGDTQSAEVKYFGNEAKGDLNGDGQDDQAFLVTANSGGSGTFYYVVVALKDGEGYKTTNAFLIGDRIAPQSTEIHSDSRELHVNYADRKKGEPMTTLPSQAKVLLLKVTPAGVLEGLMK